MWPLAVAATVIVGVWLTQWTSVRLLHVELPASSQSPPDGAAWLRDSLERAWTTDVAAVPTATLRRWADRVEPGSIVLLVGNDDRLVATSDSSVATDDVSRASASGPFTVHRRLRNGSTERSMTIHVPPLSIPAVGTPRGALLIVRPPPNDTPRTLVVAARRAIWSAVTVASIAAALVTLLLAAPIVRQVRRIGAGAGRVRRGEYDARVAVTTHDELGELEISFNEMAESLEAGEAARRNTITDVAHELRTPLTNVIGLLEAIRDGVLTANDATLSAALRESESLKRLVEDLQVLSLAESNALHVQGRPTNLAGEAALIVATMQAVAPNLHIEEAVDSARCIAVVDPLRFGQILRNLVQNAVTNTPSDGEIVVRVQPIGDTVVTSVRDSGRGIPAEHLAHIWRRFHRVDPSRDRASGGTGLGLALARELARAMGGDISVQSTLGAGSTFSVAFPSVAVGRPS